MELERIIKDEYSTEIVENEPYTKKLEETIGISLSEDAMGVLLDWEYWIFTQGFIRGIAAAKGGLG